MSQDQLVISHALDEGRVSLLTLNRDAKRNALSVAVCHQLEEALRRSAADGARAVVLTAAGSVFSAGADLNEKDFAGELYPALEHLMTVIRRHPTVVVAAVDGPAIGAGAMLAMLNRHYPVFSPEKLKNLAFSLGADVPFFLGNRTAWVTGAGENIEFLNSMSELPEIVIINPGFPVSARWAYTQLAKEMMQRNGG